MRRCEVVASSRGCLPTTERDSFLEYILFGLPTTEMIFGISFQSRKRGRIGCLYFSTSCLYFSTSWNTIAGNVNCCKLYVDRDRPDTQTTCPHIQTTLIHKRQATDRYGVFNTAKHHSIQFLTNLLLSTSHAPRRRIGNSTPVSTGMASQNFCHAKSDSSPLWTWPLSIPTVAKDPDVEKIFRCV